MFCCGQFPSRPHWKNSEEEEYATLSLLEFKCKCKTCAIASQIKRKKKVKRKTIRETERVFQKGVHRRA